MPCHQHAHIFAEADYKPLSLPRKIKMNDVYTKDALVLRLSVDHKNLSTKVTAEARHRQLSGISKY